MTNDNTKFWALLTVVILAVAIGITFVDLAIKAAILEESNELKRLIWGEEERLNESGTEGSISGRAAFDDIVDSAISAHLLDTDTTRMEAGNVSNGDSPAGSRPRNKPHSRRVDRSGDTEIPPAN